MRRMFYGGLSPTFGRSAENTHTLTVIKIQVKVISHFRLSVQFCGFAGSFGPSQLISSGSRGAVLNFRIDVAGETKDSPSVKWGVMFSLSWTCVDGTGEPTAERSPPCKVNDERDGAS
jgi:hypothetical protein